MFLSVLDMYFHITVLNGYRNVGDDDVWRGKENSRVQRAFLYINKAKIASRSRGEERKMGNRKEEASHFVSTHFYAYMGHTNTAVH